MLARHLGGFAQAGFVHVGLPIASIYRLNAERGESPNDIDTWVQGQLMKNIHYNSNVKVHRVLARATPDARWRLTAAASSYRADTLNNIGGVISTLAGPKCTRCPFAGVKRCSFGAPSLGRHSGAPARSGLAIT